jgi:hypothetical protein
MISVFLQCFYSHLKERIRIRQAERNMQFNYLRTGFFEDMREPPLRKTWEYSNITKPLVSYERGWPQACLDGLIKPNPGLPLGCQVNIKCFYAKSTCLGSNYRNISSLTLVQKVIPGYLQRTVDNYS